MAASCSLVAVATCTELGSFLTHVQVVSNGLLLHTTYLCSNMLCLMRRYPLGEFLEVKL